MEEKRASWGSNIGFLFAAIGSAVGLGNIWGFPYKMGKSGGLLFLLVYVALTIVVGFVIMVSELALGRKTGRGAMGAYYSITKKFKWLGWLAVLAPFLIMSFYSVLGGYCLQYMSLNMAELSFGIQSNFDVSLGGSGTFGAMLTNPLGCAIFTLVFLALCYFINKSGVAAGIEKFNKIGMPALFVMLVIIIIRALTLDGAVEGLKFMFKPGYAVEAGFISEAPSFISVLASAGGQMFFSLSLAMGVMITYGSYLGKKENLKKNSVVIIAADTIVAIMAGIAVIPAAVANGIKNGVPYSEISLGGPKLLFVTLQDVFAEMGAIGPLFGVVFYLLVLIAAISSAISLTEVVVTFFMDRAASRKKEGNRQKITLWVCIAIAVEAILVAIDGLGASGIFKFWSSAPAWKDCFLDFMDCWSEGIAMPLGAMIMSVMVGWELKSKPILEEIDSQGRSGKGFVVFYKICIMFVTPLLMAFILAGQLLGFFQDTNAANASKVELIIYIVSGVLLIASWVLAIIKSKKASQQR